MTTIELEELLVDLCFTAKRIPGNRPGGLIIEYAMEKGVRVVEVLESGKYKPVFYNDFVTKPQLGLQLKAIIGWLKGKK
jgi:hypothetical protein